MGHWPFKSPNSGITAEASVSANVEGLSVGYKEESTLYSISLPYAPQTVLTATLYKLGMVDNITQSISTSFAITSISQPISATVDMSLPFYNRSLQYSSFIQVQPGGDNVSLLSIIITVSVIGVLCICGSIIGCVMVRYHRLASVPPIKIEADGSVQEPKKNQYEHTIHIQQPCQ